MRPITPLIPDSLFVYNCTDDATFKVCWGIDNLWPLYALENIKKGNGKRNGSISHLSRFSSKP